MRKTTTHRPKVKQTKHFITTLKQVKPELALRYKVKSLGIFGSYIRNEQKRNSDLDVLVEFDDPSLSLLKFIECEHYLSDLLGVRVDLVEKSALKPTIGKRILSEVVLV